MSGRLSVVLTAPGVENGAAKNPPAGNVSVPLIFWSIAER